MGKLDEDMLRVIRRFYSKIKLTKEKRAMHKAALDFLKLKDIPDKIELGSVELVRKERTHA